MLPSLIYILFSLYMKIGGIRKLMKKALSNHDIVKFFNGQIKILIYPQLAEYNSIDELLSPYGQVIILYLTSENFGHWVALFKIDRNNIEFFDSYSMKPDEELKMIDENIRYDTDQEIPHLSHLLLKCNYIIHYNDTRLQKMKNDVNTCGRHCITRLACKNLFIDDYIKLINSFGHSPDIMVTYFTRKI